MVIAQVFKLVQNVQIFIELRHRGIKTNLGYAVFLGSDLAAQKWRMGSEVKMGSAKV